VAEELLGEFWPGDEVELTVTFTHGTVIASVDVVYAHTEHPTFTLTMSGNPELAGGSSASGGQKRSSATVSAVVDVAHMQGSYRLDRVVFYTFAGDAILTDAIYPEQWPDLVIHAEEPGSIRDVGVQF
jgi:hypothetical protein